MAKRLHPWHEQTSISNITFNIEKYPNLIDVFISPDNTTYKKISLDSSNSYAFTPQEQSWKSLFLKIILNSTADQSDTPVLDAYTLTYIDKAEESIKLLLDNPSNLNLTITSITVESLSNPNKYCSSHLNNSYISPLGIAYYAFSPDNCSFYCLEGEKYKVIVATECGTYKFVRDC